MQRIAFARSARNGFAALAATVAAPALAHAAETATKIDTADTAWMISATGLVLMMSVPGLALFYCGMVRKKNVLATMAQNRARRGGARFDSLDGGRLQPDLHRRRSGARLARSDVPARHGDELGEPTRQEPPRVRFHDLPDDVRRYHGRPGGRLGGRSHAVFRVSLVRRRLAVAGLCADRALGVGRRIPCDRRRDGFRRRARRASQRRCRGPRGLHDDQARGAAMAPTTSRPTICRWP